MYRKQMQSKEIKEQARIREIRMSITMIVASVLFILIMVVMAGIVGGRWMWALCSLNGLVWSALIVQASVSLRVLVRAKPQSQV